MRLTPAQLAGVHTIMQVFVDDDLARGIPRTARLYCHACQQGRPLPGFVQYGRYHLCTSCATEYEVALLRHAVVTAGQYVRDKHFGEEDRHALALLALDDVLRDA